MTAVQRNERLTAALGVYVQIKGLFYGLIDFIRAFPQDNSSRGRKKMDVRSQEPPPTPSSTQGRWAMKLLCCEGKERAHLPSLQALIMGGQV